MPRSLILRKLKMQQRAEKFQRSELQDYLDSSNTFYQNLLGYKPEQTSLQQVPENQWGEFTQTRGLNPNSSGIYLPRNQTAVIQGENPLSLFHEYFGHGLYCEQSLQGRKLVDLEKKLLGEEKQEFEGRQFVLEDVQNFRVGNQTFQELDEFRRQNLGTYERFAVFTEYLLSEEFGLGEMFERKYDSLQKGDRESVEEVIGFNQQYGDLATFYASGLARRTTPERIKRLLEGVYGSHNIQQSKLILLTGSKKPFSDIDLFASSNYLQPTKNSWLDLIVFDEKDFERRVRLFEAQITHPIVQGEFIAGDKNYLEEKRKQLQEQPITEEAIQHNLALSTEQGKLALDYPFDSNERKIGESYSQIYLTNALALKDRKRYFTKEELDLYSRSEGFIQLKGGIE